MKIKEIKFPDGCVIAGWDRTVFMRRMHRTFEGSVFSVCDLDHCRQAVLGNSDANELRDELQPFHCAAYEDMTADDVAALHQKAAEYVGVSVTMQPSETVVRKVERFGGKVLMGAFAVLVMAVCATSIVLATDAKDARAAKYRASAEPLSAMQTKLSLAANNSPSEPVFTMSMNTKQPRLALEKVAGLVRNYDSNYSVTVEITLLNEPDTELSPQQSQSPVPN